jgi:alkylated DNA nucleotide flippase Atl1
MSEFYEKVIHLVSIIPKGRVMTYGDIAALAGKPRAARIVGGIAHQASCANLPACGTGPQPADLMAFRADFASVDSLHRSSSTARSATQQESTRSAIRMNPEEICPMHDINWHRVVKKGGRLAEGYPGGVVNHKRILKEEGIDFIDLQIADMKEVQWWPRS